MNAMHKAGAILGGHKKQMLIDAGLVVVEKERLDALEALWDAIALGVVAVELMTTAVPGASHLYKKRAEQAEEQALQALARLEGVSENE